MILNERTLIDFARRGAAAQKAVDVLLNKMKTCPYDGKKFLPQTHNQKFCSYECRWNNAAEVKHVKRLAARNARP